MPQVAAPDLEPLCGGIDARRDARDGVAGGAGHLVALADLAFQGE